jgi:hypothetical protein
VLSRGRTSTYTSNPFSDNGKELQNNISDIQLVDLLPNKVVKQRLKNRWAVLVSKYITPLKPLQDVVLHHIPRAYSNEMSEKSTMVRFEKILFNDILFVI